MQARSLTLVLMLALPVVFVGSTALASGHPKKAEDEQDSPLVKPGKAKVGDRTWCPVSGEIFEVGKDAPTVRHEGKTYYFCCPGCDTKFAENPEKYLKTKPKH